MIETLHAKTKMFKDWKKSYLDKLTTLGLLQAFEESTDWVLLSRLAGNSDLSHIYVQLISLHKGEAVEPISKFMNFNRKLFNQSANFLILIAVFLTNQQIF